MAGSNSKQMAVDSRHLTSSNRLMEVLSSNSKIISTIIPTLPNTSNRHKVETIIVVIEEGEEEAITTIECAVRAATIIIGITKEEHAKIITISTIANSDSLMEAKIREVVMEITILKTIIIINSIIIMGEMLQVVEVAQEIIIIRDLANSMAETIISHLSTITPLPIAALVAYHPQTLAAVAVTWSSGPTPPLNDSTTARPTHLTSPPKVAGHPSPKASRSSSPLAVKVAVVFFAAGTMGVTPNRQIVS